MTIHYSIDGKPACGAKLLKHDRVSGDVCMPTCAACGDIVRAETLPPAKAKQFVELIPDPYILMIALSRVR